MSKTKPTHNAIFAIVIASFLWGSTGTAASFLQQVSPLAIGAFAMGMGGLLLVLTSYSALRQDGKTLKHSLGLLLLGGVCVATYPLAFYTSMHWTGVAIGTLVSIASAPLFSVILERLINHKPITLNWLLGFALGSLGVVLLFLGKSTDAVARNSEHTQAFDQSLWGILLGLLAGLTYAVYAWVAKQLIQRGVTGQSAMASQFGIAAVLLLPVLLATGDNLFATAGNRLVALYMAAVPMFLGYLLFGYGLRFIPASQATLITLVEPVVASLFAVVIVGERFAAIGWLGMLLVALCILVQVLPLPSVPFVKGRVNESVEERAKESPI